MRMIVTIAGREFKNLFLSPLAWSILAMQQAVLAYLFLAHTQRFLGAQEKLAAIEHAPGFTALIVAPFYADAAIVLLLVTPLLTMRSVSEERRSKTLLLLQAAPLSNTHIVCGKALGIFGFLLASMLLTVLMPLALSLGGAPDFGMLGANNLALLLLASLCVSVGVWTSCLTRYPALAAIAATCLLLLLWLLDWTAGAEQTDHGLWQYLSLPGHYRNLQSGLIDSADALYFLLSSAAFLVLSVYRLENQRFPGGHGFPLPRRTASPPISIGMRLRLKNLAATLTLLAVFGIAAWCSMNWRMLGDWTFNAGNTLSETSRKTLDGLPDEVRIDVYLDAEAQQLRQQIAQLSRLYQRYKPNLQLRFIDPKADPQTLRELGVEAKSAIFIYYQGRSAQLTLVNENTLTNTLLQLAYDQEKWISVLTGHGERSPVGKANYDFGAFGALLQKRKLKVYPLNLGQLSAIPDNTALLVIAGPRTEFLPGEIGLVLGYLRRGGNLLWLTDPEAAVLPALREELGIALLPGIIVDHQSQLYKLNDPSFVLLTAYPDHPLTAGQRSMTLFPQAAALQSTTQAVFKIEPVLVSSDQSWTETGPIAGTIAFDQAQNETRGPLNLGVALTRRLDNGGEQRIAMIGDGDFLSNAYIGNVGNREFGFKLMNWLTHQDRFIAIESRRAPDAQLNLDLRSAAILAYSFLIILPALLFGSGFAIWFWRKRR